MPEERRILRLQQLILEEVATAIQAELDDPRIGMVTVTKVKLAPDLGTATVYWSTLEPEGARRTTARGLENALPYIQRRVAKAIGTRVTPTLAMRYDPSLEKAQRLNDIFNRLRQERGEPPMEPEPGPVTDAVEPAEDAGQEPEDDAEDEA